MTTATAVKPPHRARRSLTTPSAFWLPFTPNRAFKKRPRLISRAKDMHYYTPEGRAILDGTAGLWCCNAGHNRPSIVAAIQRQAAELDYTRPSSSPIRWRSSLRRAWRNSRRAISIMSSSATLARKPATRRLRSRSPITMCGARLRARALSAASAAITAWASAAFLSAAWSTTSQALRFCSCPASIICRRPTTASIRPSPRASRNGALISPTRSRASWRCTMRPPSPR